jgi:hypothetical protein
VPLNRLVHLISVLKTPESEQGRLPAGLCSNQQRDVQIRGVCLQQIHRRVGQSFGRRRLQDLHALRGLMEQFRDPVSFAAIADQSHSGQVLLGRHRPQTPHDSQPAGKVQLQAGAHRRRQPSKGSLLDPVMPKPHRTTTTTTTTTAAGGLFHHEQAVLQRRQ